MTARRIIPCLDVKDGRVVKGVRFEGHRDMGDAADLAARYRDQGADELVFYDITASPQGRTLDYGWVRDIARLLDIPFSVAGGIRSVEQAARCLDHGADKVSINSPALERPTLISDLAARFGAQCVVVGVDSKRAGDDWFVHQYTGDPTASSPSEPTRSKDRLRMLDERDRPKDRTPRSVVPWISSNSTLDPTTSRMLGSTLTLRPYSLK